MVPFNRTGYICHAPRTAGVPFRPERTELFPKVQKSVPILSFRPERQRSGGIYPSCKYNLRKVKLATWEDPSTPFPYGRDDMSRGVAIQPHRLYLQRGGRQIAAPTCVVPLRPLFLQCRTPYRASSTAYGGPPSPKGKVLRNTIHPHGLYSLRPPERHTGRSLRFR